MRQSTRALAAMAAGAAVLSAAGPAPAQTPGQAPGTALAPANVSVSVGSGLHYRRKIWNVAGERVRVNGRMNEAAAGESVTVELWRGGARRSHRRAKVGRGGRFFTFLTPRGPGGYAVRAVHEKSDKVEEGTSERAPFKALRGRAHRGSRGVAVKLMQLQLARLAYATPKSGRFDDATARAVLAYRKVNRMRRIGSANHRVFARLFRGQGGFRLRYPRAGKHVEADLRRQVLVLAQHGRPWRIFHMSSGKPSTPTVRGTFRFYRKGPGYNAKGMYYSNYFIRGYAIHGYAEVPPYAASHGCIRVPIPNAISIYRWIALGNRIFVYR
jgi:hypothetical protein